MFSNLNLDPHSLVLETNGAETNKAEITKAETKCVETNRVKPTGIYMQFK